MNLVTQTDVDELEETLNMCGQFLSPDRFEKVRQLIFEEYAL